MRRGWSGRLGALALAAALVVAAGGCRAARQPFARVYVEKTYPDVVEKTRVLAYSEPIPNDSVAVRPGLDPGWRDRVVRAFLALVETPEGATVLKDLYRIEGFEPARDADYDMVRRAVKALNLDLAGIK